MQGDCPAWEIEGRRARGRPRGFDEVAKERIALRLFWAQGAAATGTRSLQAAMGLNASSLRNTWGAKDELLLRVTARYRVMVEASVLAHLEQPNGREALRCFFEALVKWVGGSMGLSGVRGCLVLNLALEGEPRSPKLRRIVKQYQFALHSRLEGALARLPMPAARAKLRATLLFSVVVGLSSAARAGASRAQLKAMCGAVLAEVEAWVLCK